MRIITLIVAAIFIAAITAPQSAAAAKSSKVALLKNKSGFVKRK